ncbi:hypothetical protein pb186bvf_012694 [Paramecium bursaria]
MSRLQRQISSDESQKDQNNEDIVSISSEVKFLSSKRKCQFYQSSKRNQRAPRRKDQSQESEIKPKKQQKSKTITKPSEKISNVDFLNQLQNNKIYADHDENSVRSQSSHEEQKQEKQDLQPKKKKNSSKQLIKNRNKFFSNVQEDVQLDDIQEESTSMANDKDELVFKKQFVSEQKEISKNNMIRKVNEYRQKVAVFDRQPSGEQQDSVPLGIKRGLSLQQAFDLKDDDEEHPQLDLYVPQVTKDHVVSATIFFNKMRAQGAQTIQQYSSKKEQMDGNRAYNRGDFMMHMKSLVNQQNKPKMNASDMLKRFHTTSLDQLEELKASKKKNGQNNQNQQQDQYAKDTESDDSDVQFSEHQLNRQVSESESEDEINVNQAMTFEDEIIFRESDQKHKEWKQRKLMEQQLELSMDVEENNQVIEEQDEQNEDDEEDQVEQQDEQSNQQSDQEKEDSKQIYNNQGLKHLQAEEKQQSDKEKVESHHSNISSDGEQQKLLRLRREENKQKVKSREEKEAEAQKRRLLREKQAMERKKVNKFWMGNFIDQQAEQGSDNEQHDDVVKQIVSESEDNSELDKSLEEIIDNKEYDFNEENEQRALNYFVQDMHERDLNDLQKIIKGQYRGQKKNGVIDGIQDEGINKSNLKDYAAHDGNESYDSQQSDQDGDQELVKKERVIQKLIQNQIQYQQQSKSMGMKEMNLFDKDIVQAMTQQVKSNGNQKQKSFSYLTSKHDSNQISQVSEPIQRKGAIKTSNLNKLFSLQMPGTTGQVKKTPTKGIFFTMNGRK